MNKLAISLQSFGLHDFAFSRVTQPSHLQIDDVWILGGQLKPVELDNLLIIARWTVVAEYTTVTTPTHKPDSAKFHGLAFVLVNGQNEIKDKYGWPRPRYLDSHIESIIKKAGLEDYFIPFFHDRWPPALQWVIHEAKTEDQIYSWIASLIKQWELEPVDIDPQLDKGLAYANLLSGIHDYDSCIVTKTQIQLSADRVYKLTVDISQDTPKWSAKIGFMDSVMITPKTWRNFRELKLVRDLTVSLDNILRKLRLL